MVYGGGWDPLGGRWDPLGEGRRDPGTLEGVHVCLRVLGRRGARLVRIRLEEEIK